jgi:hypothetical protein
VALTLRTTGQSTDPFNIYRPRLTPTQLVPTATDGRRPSCTPRCQNSACREGPVVDMVLRDFVNTVACCPSQLVVHPAPSTQGRTLGLPISYPISRSSLEFLDGRHAGACTKMSWYAIFHGGAVAVQHRRYVGLMVEYQSRCPGVRKITVRI